MNGAENTCVTMDELPEGLKAAADPLVLDVRSRAEFAVGHVPGACNVPLDDIERSPRDIARRLPPHSVVFVHCTKGARSARAVKALRGAGVGDAVLVRASGFPEWKQQGLPVERGPGRRLWADDPRPLARAALVGIGAGVVATLASGVSNVVLSLWVSDEQKRRERRIRRGSPHEIGGALLFERMHGRRPKLAGKVVATLAFSAFYSAVMGLSYTAVRRAVPGFSRSSALPVTAAVFFLACDGVIAPALRLTPGLTRLPWQFNAKELFNHVVWNATSEKLHRADERAFTARGEA